MSGGAPTPGPPAEVFIFVMPPVGPDGQWSLAHYPRRKDDTKIHFTDQNHMETPGKPREVKWIPSGLRPGQQLIIVEKAESAGKGHFPATAPIQHGQSHRMSGRAMNGPSHGASPVTWSYEVILRGDNQYLARLDPEIIIVPDP